MIKSLKIKRRLKNLASASTTEVAMSEFRSLEEIEQFVSNIQSNFDLFVDKFGALKELFLKHSAMNRISKTPYKERNPMVKAANTPAGPTLKKGTGQFTFDSKKRQETIDKYGKDIADKHGTFVRSLDPKASEKLKVNIAPHDIKDINSKFLDTDKMEEQYDHLSYAISGIRSRFKGDQKKAAKMLAETVKLQKAIRVELDKVYTFLEKIAKKIAPATFTKTISAIVEGITEQHTGTLFKKSGSKLYLVPVEKPSMSKTKAYDLKFMWYFHMKDMTDTEGFVDEDAYLVFTGVVDTEMMDMIMSVVFLNSFVAPAKAPIGRMVFTNAASGLSKANILIGQNLGIQELETAPLPDTKKGIQQTLKKSQYGDKVSVSTQGERIIVETSKDVKTKNEADLIYRTILMDLRDSFRTLTKTPSLNLRSKAPVPQANKRFQMEFFVAVPPGVKEKSIQLTSDGIDLLRRALPLTDDQIREIVRSLNYR